MFLFFISFVLVFLSSYMISSLIAPKKSVIGLLYLFLIAFAQIVLTFEVLSLFSAIKPLWVITSNLIIMVTSAYLWQKNSRPTWSVNFLDFRNKISNSLKLDKVLMFLYICFSAFLIVTIFLAIISPVTSADAWGYHFARSVFWVLQGNLNHFEVADIRNLCLPINSEILYSWVLVFIKKDVFTGCFSFVGYLLSIISMYNIMGFLGFCTRKKLWAIFILSSFASVIVQASSTETDIIIAGLVSTSIYLYWYAIKNNKNTPIFMSALAYALAIGTKTPSIVAIPGVALFMLALSIYYLKKNFYKPLLKFLSFGIINFIIFSSYNYIQNFIHFKDFFGPESFMVVSKNYYGLKAIPANFIKYICMFFDFTGFTWSEYVGKYILEFRTHLLNFLHLGGIPDGLYTSQKLINNTLLEPVMGAGILGFALFLPTLLWSIIKPIFKWKSKRTWFLFAFAAIFLINLLCISYLLAFMTYSVRFIMFFIVLATPILTYTYFSNKNPIKYVIVLFAMFYLVFVSTHIWARPFKKIMGLFINQHVTLSEIRLRGNCKNHDIKTGYVNSMCVLTQKIKNEVDPSNKIIVFLNSADNISHLKRLEFQGYHIDFRRMEDIENINLNDYNLIITQNWLQRSTIVQHYKTRRDDYKIVKENMIVTKNKVNPCFYVENPLIPKKKGQRETYPFQVNCIFTPDFITNNNLQTIGIAGIVLLDKKEDFYVLAWNRNKPFKWRKNQVEKLAKSRR